MALLTLWNMSIDIRNVHRKLKRFSDSWNESRSHCYHKSLSELYSFSLYLVFRIFEDVSFRQQCTTLPRTQDNFWKHQKHKNAPTNILTWQKKSAFSKAENCNFGGLDVACWPLVHKFAGSHPAEAVGFLGRKNPQHTFLRRGSKVVGPML
jgi:hypothetical protein